MSKVKKRSGVTGARRNRRKSVTKSVKASKGRTNRSVNHRVVVASSSNFQVRELDPQAKCGADTSVQFLHRVIERTAGRITNHLVFFDHHGWYCEHGRACPAVGHAKRHIGWTARDTG